MACLNPLKSHSVLGGKKNNFLRLVHPLASSSSSSSSNTREPRTPNILEPTPIDPTGVVTVKNVPLTCSSLSKVVDENFLDSLSDLLESRDSSFWSETPAHDPSPPAALALGLFDDDLEQSRGQKLVDISSNSARRDLAGGWSDDGIEELRKMNTVLSTHRYHHYEFNTTTSPIFMDCSTKGLPNSSSSRFMIHCFTQEPSNSTILTSQNNTTPPLTSAESSEKDEKRKNHHAARTFRMHQSHQWYKRYLDMVKFREKHGHCLVPLNWPANPSLAHWVKRQRYQYRAKQENRHSTLTADRQELLERLGFVWDSHALGWEERWHELREFKLKYGHCRVPKNYAANMQLAIWVKCQRRQFKLYSEGKESNMTRARIEKLASLGFDFTPRKQDSVLKMAMFPSGYYHDGAGGDFTNFFSGSTEMKSALQSGQAGLIHVAPPRFPTSTSTVSATSFHGTHCQPHHQCPQYSAVV